jgi:hypothetical protein
MNLSLTVAPSTVDLLLMYWLSMGFEELVVLQPVEATFSPLRQFLT